MTHASTEGHIDQCSFSENKKYTIIGNVDKVIERIENFIKVGANHIIIRDIIGQNINASVKSAEDTLQILNKQVIPHFK